MYVVHYILIHTDTYRSSSAPPTPRESTEDLENSPSNPPRTTLDEDKVEYMHSSPLSSPIMGPRRKKRRLGSCRRIDKLICSLISFLPLALIYGITTWAVYTEAWSISFRHKGGLLGTFLGTLGLALYFLANWSYTAAVFTSPGSPFDNKHAYSHLPTTEHISETASTTTAITVKSDGATRFCKKCQCRKPDRTHHCSTCQTCVLKMDHHCPWLANCLGFYNYKSFILFLIYTSLFSLLCFGVSTSFVYNEVFAMPIHREDGGYENDLTPVNWVLLAVISGVVGIVLTGFTIWHLMLVGANMTTIESMEKVRYTAPTLLTGAPPPGARPLYSETNAGDAEEREAAFNRYNSYIIEQNTKKLPHAFNLGRARNFASVFGGSDQWWKWGLPIWSGVGDGWNWDTSQEWREAVDALRVERERMRREQGERERAAGWGYNAQEEDNWNRSMAMGTERGLVASAGGKKFKQSKAERILGRLPGSYSDMEPRIESIPMKRLKKGVEGEEESEDEHDDDILDIAEAERRRLMSDAKLSRTERDKRVNGDGWESWNGLAEDERDKWV
ncbi:palmitoyltransferase for Vac8p [Rhizina undulata]